MAGRYTPNLSGREPYRPMETDSASVKISDKSEYVHK